MLIKFIILKAPDLYRSGFFGLIKKLFYLLKEIYGNVKILYTEITMICVIISIWQILAY